VSQRSTEPAKCIGDLLQFNRYLGAPRCLSDFVPLTNRGVDKFLNLLAMVPPFAPSPGHAEPVDLFAI
jgi:hypothetical protein